MHYILLFSKFHAIKTDLYGKSQTYRFWILFTAHIYSRSRMCYGRPTHYLPLAPIMKFPTRVVGLYIETSISQDRSLCTTMTVFAAGLVGGGSKYFCLISTEKGFIDKLSAVLFGSFKDTAWISNAFSRCKHIKHILDAIGRDDRRRISRNVKQLYQWLNGIAQRACLRHGVSKHSHCLAVIRDDSGQTRY